MPAKTGLGLITRGKWGAWCDKCQDGLNGTSRDNAEVWAQVHNHNRHTEPEQD
jgi:hypothetical protein